MMYLFYLFIYLLIYLFIYLFIYLSLQAGLFESRLTLTHDYVLTELLIFLS